MFLSSVDTRFLRNQSYRDYLHYLKTHPDFLSDSDEVFLRSLATAVLSSIDRLCDFWYSALPDPQDLDGSRSRCDQAIQQATETIPRHVQNLPEPIRKILHEEEREWISRRDDLSPLLSLGDMWNRKIQTALDYLEGLLYWLSLVERDGTP